MWLISCSDDHWQGRRKWLRPGTKHLFGRSSTKPDDIDQAHYISHRSVSRKHFYVTVGDVPSSATTSLHTKSSITIEAAGKTGTWLDGERLAGDDLTKTLSGNRHTFQLGNAEATLTLEWRPVVLAFTTGVPKTAKAKGTALAGERERLDRCDVKLATEYISNHTTHAVAKKRNTSAVLQALLQGKWVVTTSFVEALVVACKQDGKEPDGSPRPSPLERDFDQYWPKEDEFICPTGGEPVSRPDSWLQPSPTRAEMFTDYTFLFLDSTQHASLSPVVNAGGGKSLCFDFKEGESTVADVVKFVKELAGKKSARRFTLSEVPTPGGIVMVQANLESFLDRQRELDVLLDQESVDQKDLLDIVLSTNATMLRQPPQRDGQDSVSVSGSLTSRPDPSSIPAPPHIPTASAGTQQEPSSIPRPPPATSDAASMRLSTTAESQANPDHAEGSTERRGGIEHLDEDAPAPPPKRRRRFITQKFQGFDDFEASSIVSAAPKSPDASMRPSQPSQAASAQNMTAGGSIARPAIGTRQAEKRPAPVETEEAEEETEEQRRERMFPGQAAYKRRKTEEAAAAAAKSASISTADRATPAVEESVDKDELSDEKAKGKAKKSKQDTDLKAKITATREAQEEEHRLKEESLRQGLGEGEEIPMLGKRPGMLVEYDLPLRDNRPSIVPGDNPAWAGRPNYKKFKKQRPGESVTTRTNGPAEGRPAMIALEETTTRDNSFSGEYWLEHGDLDPRHLKQKQKQKAATPQATSQDRASQSSRHHVPVQASSSTHHGEGNARDSVDDDERAVFRRRLQSSREDDEAEAEANAAFDAPRGSGASTSQSTLGTETQKKAAGKRPAAVQLGPAATKKPRQTIATLPVSSSRGGSGLPVSIPVDDDEDDDPRAFRRKRR